MADERDEVGRFFDLMGRELAMALVEIKTRYSHETRMLAAKYLLPKGHEIKETEL